MLVGLVGFGLVDGHGAQVLDGRAGDAVADLQAHLADRAMREADVAAHDEHVALALEQVERADVRLEDGGDASRRLVEEGDERHRPRRERDEVEDTVEALVPAAMDSRLGHVVSKFPC